jgi:O-acetyl-ADP-ribose deacetylase (regulator of RNase III)
MEIINKNIIFADETIIAHGCNCQGKMGSGVAKAIRNRWPKAYMMYAALYAQGKVKLGGLQLVEVENQPGFLPTKIIANCFTQEYYGYDGKNYASINAIETSLKGVATFAQSLNYSVALPPIGCGLGGLSWEDVGPMIEKIFTDHGVRFRVYNYQVENWKS